MTQAEIYENVQNTIPDELWKKFSHLSFGEMAEEPELEEYADDLRQAESDWFSCTGG